MRLRSLQLYQAAIRDAHRALALLTSLNEQFPHQYVPVTRLKRLIAHLQEMEDIADELASREAETARRNGIGGSGR